MKKNINQNIIVLTAKELPKVIDIKKYNEVIKDLKELSKGFENIYILIDKSVEFINPLFTILFLDFYETKSKENLKFFIDITNLEDLKQHAFLIHLQQFKDYKQTDIVSLFNRTGKNIPTDINNFQVNDNLLKNEKILIQYLTKEIHNETQLKIENKYNHLPIVKITNIDQYKKLSTNINENRQKYYDELQLDLEEKKEWFPISAIETIEQLKEEVNIWNIIFNKYLAISTYGNQTMIAFRNILYEIADNIRKHTQTNKKYPKANGYVSFYKNENKENEFFICDNFEQGFLETYLQTLRSEKQRIEELHTQRTKLKENQSDIEDIQHILSSYQEDIDKLENISLKNDIEVLTSLFDTSSSPKMHQAGRMIMHFGIPTLVRLLILLGGKKSTLNIFICMGKERSYEISYKNGTKKPNIERIKNLDILGTYIYLSFPSDANIKQNNEQPILNIKPITYKEIFKDKKILLEQIESFQRFRFKEIEDKDTINKKIGLFKDEQNSNRVSEQIVIQFDTQLERKYGISDMLRAVYSYTYHFNIKDVLITHFPINVKENYLKILIEILYKDETIEYKNDTLNIAFLDSRYPKVVFIGGHNKIELCSINYKLSQAYNHNKEDFTKDLGLKPKKIVINSKLFNQNNDTKQFLPFELFLESKDKNSVLFADIINDYLDYDGVGNIPLHVDTKNGFHLEKFYFLKSIFENSHWINRIAFSFARYIDSFGFIDIVLVGTFKYSAQIVSTTKAILLDKNYICKDFMIYNEEKDKEKFKYFYKNNQDKNYFFFSPVILNGQKITEFFKIVSSENKYCAINIYHDNENTQFKNLLTKKVKVIDVKKQDCEVCFYPIEKPLYELDEDGYSIKDLYLENPKPLKDEDKYSVSWKNSIYFGHTYRNEYSSHYLYYIRTIFFFEENQLEIGNFILDLKKELELKKEKEEKLEKKEKNTTNVALVPINETNQKFATLVEQELFNNDITIHYFNLIDKQKVFYEIDDLKIRYTNNPQKSCNFYFIDDEVATQSTLNTFKDLLYEITNHQVREFDEVIVLIDRTTENSFFKSFVKIPIVPIKIGYEECYLCKRKKYFKDLMEKSSLVFIKQQFRLSVHKLQNKKTTDIEYKKIEFLKDFTNYLKMSAIRFIYKHINLINIDNIDKYIDLFVESSYEYLIYIYLEDKKLEKKEEDIIKDFCYFEAKIALIKAISFPKLIYFKSIRELAHNFIKKELKKEKNEIMPKNKDSLKIVIEYILDKDKTEAKKKEKILKKLFPEIKEYEKLNIDYINSLIVTSAYLNMNIALDGEMIKFFYFLSKEVKKQNLDHKLLHKYPIAVKMLIEYSEAKSKYFDNQLLEEFIKKPIYNFDYKKEFSLIFALFLENNKYIDVEDKISIETYIDRLQTDKFNDKIEVLQEVINIIIQKANISSIDKDKVEFYINTSQSSQNPELRNIFNNLEEIKDSNSIEYKIYKGATTDKKYEDKIVMEYYKDNYQEDDEYNIWCNYFSKDESKTYIRITRTLSQNNALTDETKNPFEPVALLVFKHIKNTQHLKLSKYFLMYQSLFIDIIDQSSLLQSAIIDYYYKLKQKTYEEIISNINHSTFSKVKIHTRLDNLIEDYKRKDKSLEEVLKDLEDIKDFSIIIEYVASLGKYYDKSVAVKKVEEYGIENIFFIDDNKNEFYQEIINFLNIKTMQPLLKNNNRVFTVDKNICNFPKVKIEDEILKLVFFEFVLNAIKYGKEDLEIIIYCKNEKIVIENEKKGKNDEYESYKVGLPSIENILKTDGIIMEILEDNPQYYRVELSKEK